MEHIGIEDDFFEMGGESLRAMRVVTAIFRALAVEVPVGDLFDAPVARAFAAAVAMRATATREGPGVG